MFTKKSSTQPRKYRNIHIFHRDHKHDPKIIKIVNLVVRFKNVMCRIYF